jgi:hypothetical protein
MDPEHDGFPGLFFACMVLIYVGLFFLFLGLVVFPGRIQASATVDAGEDLAGAITNLLGSVLLLGGCVVLLAGLLKRHP